MGTYADIVRTVENYSLNDVYKLMPQFLSMVFPKHGFEILVDQ